MDTIHRVARQAQPVVAEMVDRIRRLSGGTCRRPRWRQDGTAMIWTFSTPTDRYFVQVVVGARRLWEALGDCGRRAGGDFYEHIPLPWPQTVLGTPDAKRVWRRDPDDAAISVGPSGAPTLRRGQGLRCRNDRKASGYQGMSPNPIGAGETVGRCCHPFSNNEGYAGAALRRIERLSRSWTSVSRSERYQRTTPLNGASVGSAGRWHGYPNAVRSWFATTRRRRTTSECYNSHRAPMVP